MKVIGVIPARYASVRFEGKLLAPLLGKPVIQHVWERAAQSKLLDDLIIACDDHRIEKRVKEFSAKVKMTSKDHLSGSDRIAEIIEPLDVEIVINIQGDEPLINHFIIDDLARSLIEDQDAVMATCIKKIVNEGDLDNPNVVKVVINAEKNAIYFSRSKVPFNRGNVPFNQCRYFKHIGLYAYRKEFLLTYKMLRGSHLEKIEGLEQLRALEAGYPIKTIQTNLETHGVDTEEDLISVERYLKSSQS